MRKFWLYVLCVFGNVEITGQITNYVSNGSFESLNSNSVSSLYNVVNYWQSIDTGKACDYLATLLPPISNAPGVGGYQYPRTGNNYIISQFIAFRGYPRNRLKQKLKPQTVYCVTYYVVNTNNNPYAVDGFGAYFADETLDTITQCNVALSYLHPQVKNPDGNIIIDTLNWVPVTGTFVANGTEKYMVIGNFKTDAATNSLMINPTYSTTLTADICIDDVSCIELNLPAFAGRDTFCFAGDSVFIGREPDVGIDEACVWYKLPQTIPIDTVAGFWVKPTTTSTYVVRQEICGLVKWDTVRVFMDAVGSRELNAGNFGAIKLFPNPARKMLNISGLGKSGNVKVSIEDMSGRRVLQNDLVIVDGAVKLFIDLIDGAYIISIETAGELERKKLLIAR